MKTNLFKIIAAISLISSAIFVEAAWTINPVTGKRWRYEITDGTWTLGCNMLDEEGNFTIGDPESTQKIVVNGVENDLDLSTINTDLDTSEMDYTLTEIGSCAFEGYTINNLFIPNTVTNIKDYAFKKSVTGTVTFEEGSQLFRIGSQAFYESQVTSFNLDACTQLDTVSGEAFRNCSLLTSLSKTGVIYAKIIGSHFAGNSNLLTGDLYFPELVEMTGSDHFKPTKITSFRAPKLKAVANYCFDGVSTLEYVELSEVCTVIGDRGFQNCSSLTNITLFSTIEKIDAYAFSGCSKLVSICETDFPVLNYLGDHAFTKTSSLVQEFNAEIYEGSDTQTYIFEDSGITKIYMPNFKKSATGVFYNMKNLTDITISSEIESFAGQFLQNASALTNLTPNVFPKATRVGRYAFGSCEKLEGDYYFPTATVIDDHAFVNTKAIDSITADAVVELLPNYNFENCAATNISLKSVMNISYGCFQNAKNLQDLILNSGITNIAGRAFYNCYFTRITPTKYYNLQQLDSEIFSGASVYNGSIDFKGSTAITVLTNHVFAGASNFSEIRLPASITEIEKYCLEKTKSCDIYFYGPRPIIGPSIFKEAKWNTIVVMPEHVDTWTVTDESTTFTPLEDVPANDLKNDYPTVGKVLGTIRFTTGDSTTHWLTKYISPATMLFIK
mgnify:FL=1